MWSQLVLLLLVGFANASNRPAWEDGIEYVYMVNGRTLTSLQEVSDQYSGIFLKANLYITPRSDGILQGRVTDSQYAQIHSHMSGGWNAEYPESQLSYKQLPLNKKPFQIVIQDGLIKKLIVERELTNWEANIIKSIMSQFQWDIQGKNSIESSISALPSDDKFNGVFTTMEQTVTGKTETYYDIHPYPEYLLQSENWSPVRKLEDTDQVIEVIKFKNYTNAVDRPSYNYGFGKVGEYEPTSNKMGQFFTRVSYSRAILTGEFSKFIINKAYTVNKILVNPTFNNKEMGSVISSVNVTLTRMSAQTEPITDLTDPFEIENLVYTYESPFEQNNKVHEKQHSFKWSIDSSEESTERTWQRFRRSSEQMMQEIEEGGFSEEFVQYQPRFGMSSPPKSPLLPYLMGYQGRSIKESNDFDIKQNVLEIIREIAQEIQIPQEIIRKSTLNKYTILTSLVRLMSEDEIKFVSEQVYTESTECQERLVWVVFRDAIAESGTGPALLSYYQWIQEGKLKEYEAAEAIVTIARSVRVPTEEYMRKFYELVTESWVQQQRVLNESAILSFTDLVYRVYISRNESHNQFPVHSFGPFYTKAGREFIKKNVIPHLTTQLNEAVSKADAHKIHVYIRALGNVGHRSILEAFEPFLEGVKQVSQFQRLLMVMAMDRLIMYKPIVARSVLYKIIQNKGEIPEIRSVAVYLLMRTNPPVEMLQKLAESTHVETQEQVIAAIKSAIETAAHLKSSEFENLKQAAESAKHLLINKNYGADYSFVDLRDYIIENMNEEYNHQFLEVGSEESNLPTIVNLRVSRKANSIRNGFFSVSGMISSLRDLIDVAYRKTQQYEQDKTQRDKQQPGESKWSSANIASMLDYKIEEREQMEAFIFAEVNNIQRLWSFDNQTLEQLPEEILEKEEILKNGKKFNYVKFIQANEMALSFPTEMGIPFLYTYDIPWLLRFEGNIKAVATPQIVKDNKLHYPTKVWAEIDGSVTVSTRTQSHLSFVTPFDHQVYIAGFDKNFQAHLPISATVNFNTELRELQVEFEVKESEKYVNLLHYSTYPYTSISDVMSITPVSARPNTRIIKPQRNQHIYFDTVFGKDESDMAFRVWGHHPAQTISFSELSEMIKSEGLITMWEHLWNNAVLQQTEANIAFVSSQSSARKFKLRIVHQQQFRSQPDVQEEESFLSYNQLSSKLECDESKTCQRNMMDHVESGIKSAEVNYLEMSLEFEGNKKYKHILGVSTAKSNANPKSRILAYYKKDTKKQQQFGFEIKGYIPNSNGLDLTYSLNTEPKVTYDVRVQYGPSESEATTVSVKANLVRSNARKEYLMEQEPLYQLCNKQMQEGNFQLAACQNMTIQANFLDDIKIKVEHENVKKEILNALENILKSIYLNYYIMSESKPIPSEGENKMSLQIQFEPENFKKVNFVIRSGEQEYTLFNLSISNHIMKSLVVPHPVFHLKSRAFAVIKGWNNFRPTCVIDQTACQTFNNKTYPLHLNDKWTVVMQYIPPDSLSLRHNRLSVEEQLKRYPENYLVLIRQLPNQQKELLITLNHPDTQGKTIEIKMKSKTQGVYSGANPAASVLVDSQELQFDDEKIADSYNGFIQTYALPNGEVKLEIRNVVYMIFDGQRVKFTASHGKLRDSIYGLCGRFSKDQFEDFTTPSNCIVRDTTKFLQSFWVDDSHFSRHQRSYEWRQQCVPKVLPVYTDIISDHDIDRQSKYQRNDNNYSKTMLRPRYIEENREICFTIRPVPVCNGVIRNTVTKNVPVHCIQNTKTAYYLKKQIDQGGNPDFSHKTETRKVHIEVPIECN